MSDYQDRKDIDKLYDLVWNREANEVNFATKDEYRELVEKYIQILTIMGGGDSNTIASYREMLETIEDWKEPSSDTYTLFRGDCWTINSNFEASACVTSETDSDLTVTGTFRTENDLVGLYWYSEDLIQHPYISYGSKSDYSGVTLEFDYDMSGCLDFASGRVSITIKKKDGSIYYLVPPRYISDDHFSLDFDNIILQDGDHYIDENGIGRRVYEDTQLPPTNIEYIQFVIAPTDFVGTDLPYVIKENEDFVCEITNITVTGGNICSEHIPLKAHEYRLCEGYDDFYNFNPRRIVKEMHKLGYHGWVDLYIGASHYYEKSGTVGDEITTLDFNHTRTEKMVLDPTIPLNKSFEKWLECYSAELKAHDVQKLVISVSMENLQPPTSWRQKTSSGDDGVTGWTPSTFFYSPCNEDAKEYMQSVSEACLDILVSNGMQPILQMGEAWWWWNELDTPYQPPCFYDDATKTKYYSEFGENLPQYSSTAMLHNPQVTYWLNQQLVAYSDALREVAKSYSNGLYMALFFPPSVIDEDRVPLMMREANYIVDAYSPSKLDILQLEDYDWVTGRPNVTEEEQIRDRSHHPQIYEIGQELGFTEDNLHYFGGFVQYPQDAYEYWRYIKDAMEEAFDKNFAEVFVWAGTQIRRDNKFVGHDEVEFVNHIFNQ